MTSLASLFASVLGVSESSITDETSPENTPTWDSLNAIVLLTEIEKAYGLTFTMGEAMAVKNFAEAKRLVTSYGKNPEGN